MTFFLQIGLLDSVSFEERRKCSLQCFFLLFKKKSFLPHFLNSLSLTETEKKRMNGLENGNVFLHQTDEEMERKKSILPFSFFFESWTFLSLLYYFIFLFFIPSKSLQSIFFFILSLATSDDSRFIFAIVQ